ncbi:hypothetical protein [Zymobacter palmae]|uniref:Uncharacterized protein n=1 Tax=Zymobacter palmae TaxID=33074 RepID=A0A348HI50_9GAMM|nr:hypothetical protein [Zymobacter palmae]BBG31302.1 hypothetical protein ZBT109_2572 [Zymobacter palmae]
MRQLQRQHARLSCNIALNQTRLDHLQARNGVTNDDPVLTQQQRDELQAQQAPLISQMGRLAGIRLGR